MDEFNEWLIEHGNYNNPCNTNCLINGISSIYCFPKNFNVKIKKVIFNKPATIVFWDDGIKTIVKCNKKDKFDKEKGIAMAFMKRICGNTSNYYKIIKQFAGEENV
jgi:hypothetical protein